MGSIFQTVSIHLTYSDPKMKDNIVEQTFLPVSTDKNICATTTHL